MVTNDVVDSGFMWGATMDIGDKTYKEKDLLGNERKLNKQPKGYDDIINNVNILKEGTDYFLQELLKNNPHLLKVKEKKENEEELEEEI